MLRSEVEQTITKILFDHWDPIGINDLATAPKDEYRFYAPHLASLTDSEESSDEDIAGYLSMVARTRMDIEQAIEDNMGVARLIRSARQHPGH